MQKKVSMISITQFGGFLCATGVISILDFWNRKWTLNV
jgi:hypothetical protein